METLKTENRLCLSCMEVHDVLTVRVKETTIFKGIPVEYDSTYDYCEISDDLTANEEMISRNDLSLKNAYRRSVGLLTSDEICDIRKKYGISQTDFSTLLGWGAKTITRYESHQVQDSAYDNILRKINEDPEWFLSLLSSSANKFSEPVYQKYHAKATELYTQYEDSYRRKSIVAEYATIIGDNECCGNVSLDLDKTIDVICYYANSSEVSALYKVKLMKLLWYADALSYKRYGSSITGLAYKALPMGAVPIGYDSIINLQGINYDEIDFDDRVGCHFLPCTNFSPKHLSDNEISVLNAVISKFGRVSKDEIINAMHKERAYKETAPRDIIQYQYSKDLSID